MSVLEPHEIETKDFSLALPTLANGVHLLANGIYNMALSSGNQLESEGHKLLAHYLMEVEEDLRTINDALYPEENQGA